MKKIDNNNKPLITSWLEKRLNKHIIDTVNEAVAPLVAELKTLLATRRRSTVKKTLTVQNQCHGDTGEQATGDS